MLLLMLSHGSGIAAVLTNVSMTDDMQHWAAMFITGASSNVSECYTAVVDNVLSCSGPVSQSGKQKYLCLL